MDSAEALEIVGDLASQQWGLVTSAQAKDQGVDVPTLSRLTRSGVLERVRHGVYVTPGATQSAELELKAQWLALKPDLMAADRLTDPQHAGEAVVSHTTAAELWGIGDLWSDGIHFTTKTRRRSRQAEVTFHTADFAEEDWVIHPRARLPVTTVGRTIADLARDGHEADHLLNLVADAAANELIDQETLLEAVTGLEVEFGLKAKDVRGLKLLVSSRFPVDETEHKLSSMIEDAIGPIQKTNGGFFKTATNSTKMDGTNRGCYIFKCGNVFQHAEITRPQI